MAAELLRTDIGPVQEESDIPGAGMFELENSNPNTDQTVSGGPVQEATGEDAAQNNTEVLPQYCFVPEITEKLNPRDRLMLSYMVRHGSEPVRPRDVGALLNVSRQPRYKALAYFKSKVIMGIPAVRDMVASEGVGQNTRWAWLGEPAIVHWDTPERQRGMVQAQLPVQPKQTPESTTETTQRTLTVGGLNVVESDGALSLFVKSKPIYLPDSSARILEIVALHTEGVELGELHGMINRLTSGDIAMDSVVNHIKAIREALQDTSARDSLHVRTVDKEAGQAIVLKLDGAIPRTPQEWPEYLAAIRPPYDTDKKTLASKRENNWRSLAACRGTDREMFYASGHVRLMAARMVCMQCPVMYKCLDLAMTAEAGTWEGQRFGIFGGLDPAQRYAIDQVRKKQGEAAAEALTVTLQIDAFRDAWNRSAQQYHNNKKRRRADESEAA